VLEAPIRVVAAPGHTADSIALWIEHHGEHGAMVTGDTILGRGTTVIAQPDGSVDDYLATLDRLEGFGDARVLPGHGDELPSLAKVVRAYREHRQQRLTEVREALARLGQDASVEAVANLVYADVPSSVRSAVEASVAAQLTYLRG
jgi:glyoxylase-like metal-dependent hydrolase (beta-lactamase superfamily II)